LRPALPGQKVPETPSQPIEVRVVVCVRVWERDHFELGAAGMGHGEAEVKPRV
jgi:hypothetical protein